MKRRNVLLFLVCVLGSWEAHSIPSARPNFDWKSFGEVAIQDRGRLKPFHTFALESVQFVTGKKHWKDLSPVECVFSWLANFDPYWENEPFIRIDYGALKRALELDELSNYFTPKQLRSNQKLPQLLRETMQKEQRKERLSDLEKKAVQIQNQIGLLEAVVSGSAFVILPNPQGMLRNWFSISSLGENANPPVPYSGTQREKLGRYLQTLLESYNASDASSWNTTVSAFAGYVGKDLSGGAYPSQGSLQREVFYNQMRPFRWAWVLYAAAFVMLLIYNFTQQPVSKYLGFGFLSSAFLIHAGGFLLRCLIAGRPPVTNMYESVIWVTWGCVLFSLLIWAFYKNAVIPTAATVFAIVGLVLADNLPTVLDPGIHPLEPVLRSNFWLTIHVLTITLSYAAFALSLCLGNVVLGNYLFRPTATARIQQLSLFMYRAMQIGVVLLAAGTILGGVWADYSWGRFWGWDPKEVWALTALLLYIAVLHGRFTGWLKGFGFVSATVACFLGVLMAWYGVNFVLGVGLHSYGFGSGGLQWVIGYIVVQGAFMATAYRKYEQARKKHHLDSSIFPKTKLS